ncbi:transposase mutator type [Parafrankia sp. EAN1pec]|nr:transposase mutator type [Frankia sp. EAN1pec]
MAARQTVTDVDSFSKELMTASPDLLGSMVKAFAEALMGAEVDGICNAEYGEISPERVNRRNGYRAREWDTRAGTIELAVPKLRQGSYFPEWLLTRRRRAEQALISVVATSYLLGVSTRRVDKLVEQLGVAHISKSQVSVLAKHLDTQVEAFRSRPLDAGPYRFVQADALTMKVREDGRVINVHCLLAVGVNGDGHREILGLDVVSSEDGAGWLAFFRGLVARGLSGVRLVTSDAHRGLVNAIGSTLPGASWQRCRTHWACAELTRRRGGLVCRQDRREELFGGAVLDGCSWQVDVVFFEDGADFEEGGADGAVTDAEQLGQDSAGGDFAVVKDRGQDTFPAGDLLREDTAAGSGEALAAALLVAASFHGGCLADRYLVDECGEVGAAHAGQRGVGQRPGQRRAAVVVLSGARVGSDLLGAGEPQGCRRDRDVLLVQEMPDVGDRLTDRPRCDFQHVRQEPLRADLAQVNDGDQDPVAGREQGSAVGAGGVATWSAASLVAALLPAGRLFRRQLFCECVQLGDAHAGQARVGQQRQGRCPV